jgi:uncharacterized protein (TIGR02757 family)
MDPYLKSFLDGKVGQYNRPEFIPCDPVSIPHLFTRKEDIEISGFLAATIAWGNRKSILNDSLRMLSFMDNAPYDFVINHEHSDLERIRGVIHRTFNAFDFTYFIQALKQIYLFNEGLEGIFNRYCSEKSLQPAIHYLKQVFFQLPHKERTEKHISDPFSGSAAKRINMFLRWMIRRDNAGVDFGIWKDISPSILSCPLDVHSGNVARKLGILKRKQNDAKAVAELDTVLRDLDPEDPVKYDFALFGLGVFEKF